MLDKRLQSPVHDIYEGGQAGPVDLQDECVLGRSEHYGSAVAGAELPQKTDTSGDTKSSRGACTTTTAAA